MSSFKIKIIYFSDTGSESEPIESYFGKGFSSNYQVSIGVNVYVKEVEFNDEMATLSFWDIGEEEKFKFFRKSLLKGAFGAVLVLDLSKESSFEECRRLLDEARKVVLKKIPFILIGNAKLGRSIDNDDIHSYVVEQGGFYIEFPGDIGINFNEVLKKLTQEIVDTFVLAN